MANFDFNPEGSNSSQGGKGEWIECFEHHGHKSGYSRAEDLPTSIDFGASSGAYNSGYFNNPGYAGGQGSYYYPIGYGDSSSVTVGNAENAVAYKRYGEHKDLSVTVGDADNYAYGTNAGGYKYDAGQTAGGYGDKYGRLGYLTESNDKYANVPIDQIPDDGRATDELNRRELVRIKTENALAQTQYQPGMSHNRWLHSAYRVCANDNEAVAQQGGYQKPYRWQRNWQG
jgi:hypothetical protein